MSEDYGYGGYDWGAGIKNYLIPAILCTIFCCLPFGIVAIVFAVQVDGLLNARDYAGARRMSDNARMWCWISVGAALVQGLLICVCQLTAILGQLVEGNY